MTFPERVQAMQQALARLERLRALAVARDDQPMIARADQLIMRAEELLGRIERARQHFGNGASQPL
jgi:hypothetical protein